MTQQKKWKPATGQDGRTCYVTNKKRRASRFNWQLVETNHMRRKRKNSTLLCVFRPSQQELLTLVAQPPLPATDKQLALNDQATQCTGPSPRFCTCSFVCLHVSCNSASERWVKCNWWSRHRVNLTGISVLSTPENVQRLPQSEWNCDDRCVSHAMTYWWLCRHYPT